MGLPVTINYHLFLPYAGETFESAGQIQYRVKTDDTEVKPEGDYGKIADKYDQFINWVNFGTDRIWKQMVVQRLNLSPGMHLLDVAGGTGEIAFRALEYLKKQPSPDGLTSHITVCDISEAMMDVGKSRAQKLGYTYENITWVVGNAENLPIESESVSAYSISFGMRHVPNIDKALAEAYRVLKPGGRFVCLEFSHTKYQSLHRILSWYMRTVYLLMGLIITGERNMYQILRIRSRERFPTPEVFKGMIEKAGFSLVTYESPLFGFFAVHCGFK